MQNLRFIFIKSCLTAAKPALSRFAIKVDEKAFKPERNRYASANMPNKIFVTLYTVCWYKVKHVSGAKSLIIITRSLQIQRSK